MKKKKSSQDIFLKGTCNSEKETFLHMCRARNLIFQQSWYHDHFSVSIHVNLIKHSFLRFKVFKMFEFRNKCFYFLASGGKGMNLRKGNWMSAKKEEK